MKMSAAARLGVASWVFWALMLPVAAQTVAPQKPARKPAPAAPRAAPPAATAAPTVVTKPGFNYTLAPIPTWVTPVAAPAGAPNEAAPLHYRVIDGQVHVDAGTVTEFSRVVRVVNQAAGLASASQIEIEFDPSYQKLRLHRLDIVREGQRTSRLNRSRIELLQREKQLEQRVYDGRVTVSVVVDDVRVGDEIEFAHTLEGANPVFEGKYVDMVWLTSWRGPVLLHQHRLLAPQGRNIRYLKGPDDASVETRTFDGLRETVFKRANTAQPRPEPATPMAAMFSQQVQFSEFADWAEVAAWGERLFRDSATGPRTAAKAEELRATHADAAQRTLAALRFVQQDVRYFGVEIGAGSHRPHPADQVLQQRFGDCKDKVSLLTALLRGVDVAVRPVLVSTRLRDRTDQVLPSPLAFDHVIARVELDGKPLWLDATRGHQGGPLAARQVLGLGKGLELAPGTTALTQLPLPYDSERLRVEDRLRVDAFTDDVTLESRIVYRGDLAEGMRAAIAAQGLDALSASLSSNYLRAYPKLRSLAPIRAEELTDDDALAVVQRFAVPGFWRFPEERALAAVIVQWAPVELLLPPKSEARREALEIPYPGVVRHQVRVEFAEDVYTQPVSRRQDEGDVHFTLAARLEGSKNQLEYNAEVRIGTDTVTPAQWTGFVAAVNRALPKLAHVVVVSPVPVARMEALSAELRRLEDELRRGRLKVVTSTQAQAHFKRAVLGYQLEGGRLGPALKLQALVARGVVNDHLGQLEQGRRDFEAALAIDATSVDALNAAAVNAQGRGDAARAVALASEVLKQQPRNVQALSTRAQARYLGGELALADADWEAALEDRAMVRRGYPLLWLALSRQRAGQALDPLHQKYPRHLWPTEWPRPLLDAVFEGSDVAAVLKQAKEAKAALEMQTEAHFFLGERFAARGDAAKARDQWQRARDLGVVEFVEYNAAVQRLSAPR